MYTMEVNYVVAALVGLFIFFTLQSFITGNRGPNVRACPYYSQPFLKSQALQLHQIPAVGSSSPILSYLTASRFIWDSQNIIESGYRKVSDLQPESSIYTIYHHMISTRAHCSKYPCSIIGSWSFQIHSQSKISAKLRTMSFLSTMRYFWYTPHYTGYESNLIAI